MNLGNSLLVPLHVTASLGRLVVDNNTNSPILNEAEFLRPRLSAVAFCLATASAMASVTKRITARLLYKKSFAEAIAFFVEAVVAEEAARIEMADAEAASETDDEEEVISSRIPPPLREEAPPR